jgi:hypothetical protein
MRAPLRTLKDSCRALPCTVPRSRIGRHWPGSAGTGPDRPALARIGRHWLGSALARQILDGPKRLKVLTDGAFFGEQVCRAHEGAARMSSAMHFDDGRQRPKSEATQCSNRQRTPLTHKRQNSSSAALRFVHSLSGSSGCDGSGGPRLSCRVRIRFGLCQHFASSGDVFEQRAPRQVGAVRAALGADGARQEGTGDPSPR